MRQESGDPQSAFVVSTLHPDNWNQGRQYMSLWEDMVKRISWQV